MSDLARVVQPRAYLVPGGTWPDGPFRRDAPADLDYVVAVVAALRSAVGRRGWRIADLSRDAKVAPSTISRLLAGRTWPNLDTVVKLEAALQQPVWPRTWPVRQVTRQD